MNVSAYLRRYGPTLDDLAKEAGLSHSYVRHLARPVNAREAGSVACLKLARAIQRQSDRLARDAEAIRASIYGGSLHRLSGPRRTERDSMRDEERLRADAGVGIAVRGGWRCPLCPRMGFGHSTSACEGDRWFEDGEPNCIVNEDDDVPHHKRIGRPYAVDVRTPHERR